MVFVPGLAVHAWRRRHWVRSYCQFGLQRSAALGNCKFVACIDSMVVKRAGGGHQDSLLQADRPKSCRGSEASAPSRAHCCTHPPMLFPVQELRNPAHCSARWSNHGYLARARKPTLSGPCVFLCAWRCLERGELSREPHNFAAAQAQYAWLARVRCQLQEAALAAAALRLPSGFALCPGEAWQRVQACALRFQCRGPLGSAISIR
mmetsp:Transcript_67392/g.197040  ORF Transcript_67392/g.197040 Transcript_67392/m.197040 type:complete len:206 (-) Transcript_67392:432-1049(-)